MPEPTTTVVDPKPEDGGAGTEPLVYGTWVEGQPDNVKTLLSDWEAGLKTALKSERNRANTLEKSLRDAAKKLDEGSEARTKLEAMADDLNSAKMESTFYELAHKAGGNSIKLLFVAAKAEGLIRKDGNADFAELKILYPQLFGSTKPTPRGNAGDGTGDPPRTAEDMNTAIRRAAGRRV